jgi:hypothetical protein
VGGQPQSSTVRTVAHRVGSSALLLGDCGAEGWAHMGSVGAGRSGTALARTLPWLNLTTGESWLAFLEVFRSYSAQLRSDSPFTFGAALSLWSLCRRWLLPRTASSRLRRQSASRPRRARTRRRRRELTSPGRRLCFPSSPSKRTRAEVAEPPRAAGLTEATRPAACLPVRPLSPRGPSRA